MNKMNKFRSSSAFLTWVIALLLVAFVVGCGSDSDSGEEAQRPVTITKAVTAFSFGGSAGIVNEPAKTIAVTVPNGTDVTAMAATFTAAGATVTKGGIVQTSGVTKNDFTTPVTFRVTAADGTFVDYVVTATVAATTAKAVTAFSFGGSAAIINEAAKTIALTVPFGTNVTALPATFTATGATVTVGAAVQTSGVTTNDFTTPVTFRVTAADGTFVDYVATVIVAPNTAKAVTAFSFAGFTGAAGVINEAAKTIAVTVPFGTNVTALPATFTATGATVTVGAAVQTSGVTTNDFTTPVTFRVTAADGTFVDYVAIVTVAPNSAKAFTAYSFAGFTGAAGIINEAAKTVAVTVPFGTNLTALVATFTTTGASVKVGAAVQTSVATPNDFAAPVAYTVTAADGTTAIYTVTVTVAANSAKAITAYSFAGFSDSAGIVNEPAKTIAVTVPPGTNVTALVATFTTTGTSAKVGATVQTSTATPNDFTAPVTYTVTGADGTSVTYLVTVTPGLGPAPVLLGTAGNFVILTKTGITDVPSSAITGNIGTSPISGAAIGVTCAEVTGTIYSVDAAGPACEVIDPTLLTTAVGNMQTAYTDAAGRPAGVGPNLNVGAGTVANQTLVAGTYTWGSNVTITTDLTLNGGANDVWIFQVTGTLDISPNMKVVLTGGAQAKNVFWQVTGAVTLGSGSHFEGTVLAQTNIALVTGASLNGRLLAQTAVTLQQNTVTQP